MNLYLMMLLISATVFLGMAVTPYFGYRIALWQSKKGSTAAETGSVSIVLSALFALLGLLLAFTFSGAFSRFEDRRNIIVEEVNSIETAWLRIDLLPENGQAEVRKLFRAYTESRAQFFSLLVDRPAVFAEIEHSKRLQREIWQAVVALTEKDEYRDTRNLLLNALNHMFDITTVRTEAAQTHPPALIFVVLVMVAFVCSGMVGYSANVSKRYRLSSAHVVGLACVVTFVIYVILDVEFPRYGVVTLERVNTLFIDLLQNMEKV